MAKFTLKLIVPNNDEALSDISTDEVFLSSTITSFDSQINEYNSNKQKFAAEAPNEQKLLLMHSIAYTYNEKFSKHKNGQKDLSFDLDDKYFSGSTWELNPFARVLHVGSLLELTDRYDNVYLFIITKISPKFSNLNITYSYTCQDLFTYQLTRQNSGYNLINDENSADFIGALNIDEWADRIVKDCYITYQYIPLADGVAMYEDNTIAHYRGSGTLSNVKKILKRPYNIKDYPDYYETVPFSASGSSASAALISLAETVGLQLYVVEGKSSISAAGTTIYNLFFWFAPTKDDAISGLTYSPKREIQDFSMSFNGDALTTILNVNSTTVGDEEVGLFPSVPSFFIDFFLTNEWANTLYTPGFFETMVTGQHRTNLQLQGDAGTTTTSGYIGWPITIPDWKPYYNRISLVWDNEHFLIISIGSTVYTAKSKNFVIQIGKPDATTPSDPSLITWLYTGAVGEEIPQNLIDTSKYVYYLGCKGSNAESATIREGYYVLHRTYTDEELEFAKIADQVPWLENKLVDFTYFLRQNIISKSEYEQIMSLLLNDTRIINGRLMAYASAHFQAIHKQVTTLSAVQTQADALGASFEANIVSSFNETGATVNKITDFKNDYQSYFGMAPLEKEPLYELNNNISYLFNRYLQAEQRCLRNLYDFRRFFEERNAFANNPSAVMQTATYTITNPNRTVWADTAHTKKIHYFYSFDESPTFTQLTSSNLNTISQDYEPLVALYKHERQTYIQVTIPSKNNLLNNNNEIFVPDIAAGSVSVNDDTVYNKEFNYLMTRTNYETYFGTNSDFSSRIRVINSVTYVQLTLHELKLLHIKEQYALTGGARYHIRDPKYFISYNTEVRAYKSGIEAGITPYMLPLINKIVGLMPDAKKRLQSATFDQTAWNQYKASLPIDSLFVKDFNMHVDGKGVIQIVDENNMPYTYRSSKWYKWNKEAQTNNIELSDASALYQKYFSIPFVSIDTNAVSLAFPSDETSLTMQQLFFIMNNYNSEAKDATSKYYTSTVDTTAYGWATAGMILAGGIYAICPVIIYNAWRGRRAFARWTQGDSTDYSITYYTGSGWTQYENGKGSALFKDDPTDHHYNGDSSYPNYVLANDSDDKITDLTKTYLGWVNRPDTSTWKHYFNYLGHIAATYSTEAHDNEHVKFYIYARRGSFVSKTETFNPNENYYLVEHEVQFGDSSDSNLKVVCAASAIGQRFNATRWYPLLANKQLINFSELFTKDELVGSISWSQLASRLTMQGLTCEVSYDGNHGLLRYKTGSGSSEFVYGTYYIVHDEPYELVNIIDGSATEGIPSIQWNAVTDTNIYNNSDYSVLELKDVILPTNGVLLRQARSDMNIRLATVNDWPADGAADNTHWYSANEERIYSLRQAGAFEYCYLIGNTYKQTEFYSTSAETKTLSIIIKELACTYDENNKFIIAPTDKYIDCSGENTLKFTGNNTNIDTNITINGYQLTIRRHRDDNQNIGQMSNGEFWYRFHDRLDIATMTQYCAVIDTKLTESWMVAHNASQYCRLYVPSTWKIYDSGATNYAAQWIWGIYNNTSGANKTIQLLDRIIPEIGVFEKNKNGKAESQLTNYNIIFTQDKDTYISDKEHVSFDNSDLKDNQAFLDTFNQAFSEMGLEPKDILVLQPYGTRTYYYIKRGGMTRAEAVKIMTGGAAEATYFDGLYGMQIRRLLNCYVNAGESLYTLYSNKKILLWQKLYKRYPGLFLEKTFSDSNVRTSAQLLQMAQLAMKDYTSPETQYNITTIDALALDGYKGQELDIGSSILLNASDYYSDVDETYRALNQYLFISDISYSLRQDTDIQLTVNPIKYQDKLLQSIVKLIR